MHLLILAKRPEYDAKGRLVSGQCEAHTGDWELRLFTRQGEEKLLQGPYAPLRALQLRCRGQTPEGLRRAAAEEQPKLPPRNGRPLPAGPVGPPTQMMGADELREALRVSSRPARPAQA